LTENASSWVMSMALQEVGAEARRHDAGPTRKRGAKT
jgi:hypothetical protein